jgi:hypothetical protein
VPYTRVGELIQALHPVETGELPRAPRGGQRTVIPADLGLADGQLSPPPLFMNAICWLQDKSLFAHRQGYVYALGSSADDEMDATQKFACLSWPVPQPKWRKDESVDPPVMVHDAAWWMRTYQVTKGIRVQYTLRDDPTMIGDILIGYSGSGDY